MPSAEDNDHLVESGINFIMRFITRVFPSLSSLTQACPKLMPAKEPRIPVITPLEIVDENEGSKDGTVHVLEEFARDLGKTDDSPTVLLYRSTVK